MVRGQAEARQIVRRIVAAQPKDEQALVYAESYWLLAGHLGRVDTMFQTWAIDWSLFKQGMSDKLTRFPEELERKLVCAPRMSRW